MHRKSHSNNKDEDEEISPGDIDMKIDDNEFTSHSESPYPSQHSERIGRLGASTGRKLDPHS